MGLGMRIAAVAIASVLAAAPASAQHWVYYNVCDGARGNAALRVCASADLSLVGSTLQMRVWNMETAGNTGVGSYSTEFGGWHTIVSVGLEYMGSGTAASGQLSSAHYVFGSEAGSSQALSFWHDVSGSDLNPLRVELGGITETYREGIVGCVDPGPDRYMHVQTCNSYGFSPYVLFTFSGVNPNIDLRQYNFEFMSAQLTDGYWAKASGSGVAGPGNVVPEPITMVLLGSGLLGVGGVNLRRRRRTDVGDEEAL